MIYLKTDEEIELLRENNILVSQTLAEVGRHIKPGVTTKQLDRIIEDFIRSHGATPAFLGYQGYPASACISVNDQVVHGIPSDKVVIKEGDVVYLKDNLGYRKKFTVVGCSKDAFLGSSLMGQERFIISEKDYNELVDNAKIPYAYGKMYSVWVDDLDAYEDDYYEQEFTTVFFCNQSFQFFF